MYTILKGGKIWKSNNLMNIQIVIANLSTKAVQSDQNILF